MHLYASREQETYLVLVWEIFMVLHHFGNTVNLGIAEAVCIGVEWCALTHEAGDGGCESLVLLSRIVVYEAVDGCESLRDP
jgi:hypothetical protein